MTGRPRRGVTLIELLVVLAILGAIATIAVVDGRHVAPVDEDTPLQRIARARTKATASGMEVHLSLTDSTGTTRAIRIMPDGRVVGADAWHTDAIIGLPPDAR